MSRRSVIARKKLRQCGGEVEKLRATFPHHEIVDTRGQIITRPMRKTLPRVERGKGKR